MSLHPEEPHALHWETLDDPGLRDRAEALLPRAGPALVLVDGRSGAGKSTFAGRLAGLLGAALVHTDDLAWRHHPVAWDDVLTRGVLTPWRRGEAVTFRPPAWVAHDRPGAVEVAPSRVLVVEGVGAARATLAAGAQLVVWVQSDRHDARRRGLARDVELGRSPAEAQEFWDDWMRSEEPLLAAERPWSRADLVVNGTPPDAARSATLLAPGPLSAATNPR